MPSNLYVPFSLTWWYWTFRCLTEKAFAFSEIRKEVPVAQIIIFTADPSVVLQEVCLEAGADFYLHKTQIQDLLDILSVQLGESTP